MGQLIPFPSQVPWSTPNPGTPTQPFKQYLSQLDAIARAIVSRGGTPRIVLSAPTTFFFSNSGNDTTGTGTLANPYATLQHAYNVFAQTFDAGGQTVTFSPTSAGSTFTAGLVINQAWTGSGQVVIDGLGTTTFINASSGSAIQSNVPLPGLLTLQNFKFSAPVNGIDIEAAGTVQVNNLVCGPCPGGAQFDFAAGAAKLLLIGPYSIVAGASLSHYQAVRFGLIDMNGQQVTLSGTPSYSTFALARNGGQILRDAAPPFSGSATGQTYQAITGGIINSNGGGPNYFPGNTAGTTATNGLYI